MVKIFLYNLDQIDFENNENRLRSLATSAQIQFPIVVQLGAFATQRYYIVNRIGSNAVCNAFEAHRINEEFIDVIPVVLKAFFGLESEIDKYVTDEVDYQTMMKEHSVIVDGTNHIVVYGGSMNALHNVFPEDEAIDAPSTVLPPHLNRNDVGYTVDLLFYVGYDYDYYPDGNLTIFTRNQLVR